MSLTHYWVAKATDGKFYITTFSETRAGVKKSLVWPEAHETSEAAFKFANAHGLPILEAQAI